MKFNLSWKAVKSFVLSPLKPQAEMVYNTRVYDTCHEMLPDGTKVYYRDYEVPKSILAYEPDGRVRIWEKLEPGEERKNTAATDYKVLPDGTKVYYRYYEK